MVPSKKPNSDQARPPPVCRGAEASAVAVGKARRDFGPDGTEHDEERRLAELAEV
jgi:hypothetical protein